MKTREEIIAAMCYAWNDTEPLLVQQQMTRIFDNDIAPYMEFRQWDSYSDLPGPKDYEYDHQR